MTTKMVRTEPVDPRKNRLEMFSRLNGRRKFNRIYVGAHRAQFDGVASDNLTIREGYEPRHYAGEDD